MGLYGPFTAVAGTIQECDVDGDAAGVYIRNSSIYDLAIAFQSQKPVSTSAFGGPPWYAVIPSGDRAGIRIPVGVYGANGFPGYVWVLPINDTGSLALSGTTSANALFWIETYTDASLLPPDYASAQFQNLASEPRVITLPVPAGGNQTGKVAVSGVALTPFTNALMNPSILPRAQWAANVAVQLYTFTLVFSVSGANSYLEGALQLLQYAGVTLQVQTDLIDFAFGLNLSAGVLTAPPFIYTPPAPKTFSFLPFNASTDTIKLGINVTSFIGAASNLFFSWDANCDVFSNGVIPNVGQGTGVIKGAIF